MARIGGSRTLSRRAHAGDCRAFAPAHRSLSNSPRAGINQIADQLDLPDDRAGNELSAGGLEPARPEAEGALGLRRLAVSVARPAGPDRPDIRDFRISVDGPRSPSVLYLR